MPEWMQISDTVKERVDELQRRIDSVGEIAAQYDFPTERHVDKRDFFALASLFHGEGNTPEERQEDYNRQIREMVEAFHSEDTDRRKPYLDKMYDLRDTLEPDKLDMTKAEDVDKLLAFVTLTQTYGTKHSENTDYYDARYDTPEKRQEADLMEQKAFCTAQRFLRELRKAGKDIQVALTLPYSIPELEVLEDARADMTDREAERFYAKRRGEPVDDKIRIPIPAGMKRYSQYDAMRPELIPADMRDDVSHDMVSFVIGGFYQDGTAQKNLMNEAKLSCQDMVFIDGKSAKDRVEEKYPGLSPFDKLRFMDAMIACAMSDGSHRVEMAEIKRDPDGEIKVNLRPVRADVTNSQPDISEDTSYSWIRRKLFNWGPFKCKTRQEKIDEKLANDPEREARQERAASLIKEKAAQGIVQTRAEEKENAIRAAEEQRKLQVEIEARRQAEARKQAEAQKQAEVQTEKTESVQKERISLTVLNQEDKKQDHLQTDAPEQARPRAKSAAVQSARTQLKGPEHH